MTELKWDGDTLYSVENGKRKKVGFIIQRGEQWHAWVGQRKWPRICFDREHAISYMEREAH